MIFWVAPTSGLVIYNYPATPRGYFARYVRGLRQLQAAIEKIVNAIMRFPVDCKRAVSHCGELCRW